MKLGFVIDSSANVFIIKADSKPHICRCVKVRKEYFLYQKFQRGFGQ